MSQELHYTSVPRGLKPGTRGFCTVAHTSGLAPALAERLEGLSGYRQKFPPQDPNVGLNPVVFSHLRWSSGGQSYSILSRICYAGLDYTDRPNKYAHHVALDPAERQPGGPAWLLAEHGFMQAIWDGEPRVLPSGRRVPPGDRAGGVCHAWGRLTGDPGWAGVVAESFLADPKRTVYFLFDPGIDLLPLFVEALALIPAERRWEVSFSTYFTGLPAGMECAWRGVLRDSNEAVQARSYPQALTLDLVGQMGRPTGGALVEQARTGIRPTAAPAPVRSFVPPPSVSHHAPAAEDEAVDALSMPLTAVPVAPSRAEDVPNVPAPPPLLPPTPTPRRRTPQAQPQLHAKAPEMPVYLQWPVVVSILVALMLGLVLGGAIIFAFRPGHRDEPNAQNTKNEKPVIARSGDDAPAPGPDRVESGTTSRGPNVGPKDQGGSSASRDPSKVESARSIPLDAEFNRTLDFRPKIVLTPQNEDPGTQKPEEAKTPPPPTPAPPTTPILALFDVPQNYRAQEQEQAEAGVNGQASAKKYESDEIGEKIQSLSLIGHNDPEVKKQHKYNFITIYNEAQILIIQIVGHELADPLPIARFQINAAQRVEFAWLPEALNYEASENALRDCVLQVTTVGGQLKHFLLRKPNMISLPVKLLGKKLTPSKNDDQPPFASCFLEWDAIKNRKFNGSARMLKPSEFRFLLDSKEPLVLTPDHGDFNHLVSQNLPIQVTVMLHEKQAGIVIRISPPFPTMEDVRSLEGQGPNSATDPRDVQDREVRLDKLKKALALRSQIMEGRLSLTLTIKVGTTPFLLPELKSAPQKETVVTP